MKEKGRCLTKEALLTMVILVASLILTIFAQRYVDTRALAPMIFVLAVFLVSLTTRGYIWGILASLLSVLAVNFAFTFPYFEFNFSVPVNLFSALVVLCVAVMTSTLTTKIKYQERIRTESEREKVRANLLRAISHDLRTPLTSIYGSCSAIIENYDLLKKEQQLKLLGEIREDSEWLIRMVENLLSVTRIDGGKVAVVKVPTVLEELVDAVLVKFQKQYPAQTVDVDIPDQFISIPMDALLIEQVLINLLENAVFHAEGMTKLSLRVFTVGNGAVFEVADDGCGIPKERINLIFNGYRGKNSIPADSKKSNMGIGLSVCATIVKAHGSELQAENRKEGGAVFRFFLEMETIEHGE